MPIENENVTDKENIVESPIVDSVESVESEDKIEPRFRPDSHSKGDKSIRGSLKSAVEKVKKDLDEPIPLTSKEKREAAAKEKPAVEQVEDKSPTIPVSKTKTEDPVIVQDKPATETAPPKTSQESGIAPPAALTKEEKALWESTPNEIKQAFLRRETDSQKGVDQLKAKYQPIEDVLSPMKPLLQQYGLTEAAAVKQLFDWHRALASPHREAKANAFRALAQSHGFDLNSLAPQQAPQQQNVVASPQQTPAEQGGQTVQDPIAQLQPLLEQYLGPIQQRQAAYEAQMQKQQMDAANNELALFSKDKPHFEQVRYRMAEILTAAVQMGRPVTLQDAYDEAVWGMPDLRNALLQEQETKRQTEFQAAQEATRKEVEAAYAERVKKEAEEAARKREQEQLEKAKRANVSVRGTTPVSAVTIGGPKKPVSIRDTINAVIKDTRQGV